MLNPSARTPVLRKCTSSGACIKKGPLPPLAQNSKSPCANVIIALFLTFFFFPNHVSSFPLSLLPITRFLDFHLLISVVNSFISLPL
jgi:hypothetical protein